MMDESQLAWRDKSVCHTMYADGQMTTLGDVCIYFKIVKYRFKD